MSYDVIFEYTDKDGDMVTVDYTVPKDSDEDFYSIAVELERESIAIFMKEEDMIQLYNTIGKHLAEKEANK